jgi:RNA polymerase subunit RPABC4/transcription elongation factor Spt4
MTDSEQNRLAGLKTCPKCRYLLAENAHICRYCGAKIGYSPWKKMGAWAILILIIYGMVKCHVRLLDGFD